MTSGCGSDEVGSWWTTPWSISVALKHFSPVGPIATYPSWTLGLLVVVPASMASLASLASMASPPSLQQFDGPPVGGGKRLCSFQAGSAQNRSQLFQLFTFLHPFSIFLSRKLFPIFSANAPHLLSCLLRELLVNLPIANSENLSESQFGSNGSSRARARTNKKDKKDRFCDLFGQSQGQARCSIIIPCANIPGKYQTKPNQGNFSTKGN